jgi:hypothetical protein
MFAVVSKILSHKTVRIRIQVLKRATSEAVPATTMVYFMASASLSLFINWATVDCF